MSDLLFDGRGLKTEFKKVELINYNGKNYYYFTIKYDLEEAQYYGFVGKDFYNSQTQELILTFPEYIEGNKNVHELRNFPGNRIFLVETDWLGNETPLSQRKKKLEFMIKEKTKLKEELQRQLSQRELELERTLRSGFKEVQARKDFVRAGHHEYKEEE